MKASEIKLTKTGAFKVRCNTGNETVPNGYAFVYGGEIMVVMRTIKSNIFWTVTHYETGLGIHVMEDTRKGTLESFLKNLPDEREFSVMIKRCTKDAPKINDIKNVQKA